METYEARLLDRLKDYYHAKKDMEEALLDIEEILLLYEFDIEEIAQKYPVLHEIKSTASKKSVGKIRTTL